MRVVHSARHCQHCPRNTLLRYSIRTCGFKSRWQMCRLCRIDSPVSSCFVTSLLSRCESGVVLIYAARSPCGTYSIARNKFPRGSSNQPYSCTNRSSCCLSHHQHHHYHHYHTGHIHLLSSTYITHCHHHVQLTHHMPRARLPDVLRKRLDGA